VPEALIDAVSAGREGRACVILACFFQMQEYYIGDAQTQGTALNRGAQADARGAAQVLDRGGQAVARGSCLSQVLGRGAQANVRGAVPCASQILDRSAEAVARGAARYESHVLLSWCSGRCLDRCLRRCDVVASGEEHPADEQRSLENSTSPICAE
jgi:hypothetical protein